MENSNQQQQPVLFSEVILLDQFNWVVRLLFGESQMFVVEFLQVINGGSAKGKMGT